MTSKQAEVMRLYRQGLSTCEIARRLGVTKANVRYLRAAANGKKPKSTYRYREPCTVCPTAPAASPVRSRIAVWAVSQ